MSSAVWPNIPRFWRRRGVKPIEPGVIEITAAPQPATTLGRLFHSAKNTLLGEPFRTESEKEQRLNKTSALAVIGADHIASSVYGPESMLRALALAGGIGALSHAPALTLGILVLLALVALSAMQTIDAYPGAGGSYMVLKDNAGEKMGVLAGVTLMIDYSLNVAVSVAAGVQSVTSIFPEWAGYKVILCLAAILIMTVCNLRGIHSSASLSAAPVYLYIAGVLGVIGYGAYLWMSGGLPQYQPQPGELNEMGTAGAALGALLLLRAYTSGAVALSGVEAMANGVTAFHDPQTKNAKITTVWMALTFAFLFSGITLLAAHMHVLPDPHETETLVSRVTRTAVGNGAFLIFVQATSAVMLAVAANTAYAGFPRLASAMALDKYLPARFSLRGHRLAFSSGIISLAVLAALLILLFAGNVSGLVPLFTIAVFLSFTLSECGMVIHHWRERGPHWKRGVAINGIAALGTAVVALAEAVTKFKQGAWTILVLIPLLALVLLRIRRHFRMYDEIMTDVDIDKAHPEVVAEGMRHHILIPVESMTRADLFALGFVRSLCKGSVTTVEAVHVSYDQESTHALRRNWEAANLGVPLVVLESPYRAIVEPLLTYIDVLRRQSQGNKKLLIDVFLPEPVPKRLWHQFLHKKTTFVLKMVLMVRPGVTVTSIPYHFRT